ncbi:hypothetical protein DOP62_14110 (plasmid) [Synechococcus elongatus PCC 11801]|uniref:Uncharacterized protein n=1 Tax=Synechococcus elongatus PCC 11801 TaxID=2219813 RepID=A0ACD5A2Z1_SYNEL
MARGKLEPGMVPCQPLDPLPRGAKSGTRPIAVRLPLDIEKMLLSLDSADRVRIMRRGVIQAALENWPEGEALPEWVDEFIKQCQQQSQ